MKKYLLLLLCFSFSLIGFTQNKETNTKERKNTIRWNPTPMVFNASNLTLGYERILKKNQSFSINIGYFKLPELIPEGSEYLSLEKKGGRIGFTITADYRFYLKKYNLQNAPRGVYIGPYLGHYRYHFDNTIFINNNGDLKSDIDLDMGFNMTSIGFELGYQFVFWDKVSLDLILAGPSLSFYNGEIDLEGELELDEESDAYKYLHDEILNKYPWLETFVDLDAINTGGSLSATAVGFRYVIQIGYRF